MYEQDNPKSTVAVIRVYCCERRLVNTKVEKYSRRLSMYTVVSARIPRCLFAANELSLRRAYIIPSSQLLQKRKRTRTRKSRVNLSVCAFVNTRMSELILTQPCHRDMYHHFLVPACSASPTPLTEDNDPVIHPLLQIAVLSKAYARFFLVPLFGMLS